MIIVKKFLLNEFEPKSLWAIFLELAICKLDVFLAFTFVVWRVYCFYRNYDRIKIFSCVEEISLPRSLLPVFALIIFAHVNYAESLRHLLFETLAKPIRAWRWHSWFSEEIQGNIGGISTLSGTNIDCDDTLKVCVVLEIKNIFVGIIFLKFGL